MAGSGMGAAGWTAAAVLWAASALLTAACQKSAAPPATAAAEAPAAKAGATPAATETAAPGAGPAAWGGEVRPCRAADLNAAVVGTNGVTGGQLMLSIGIGNRADTPCTLHGPPQVQFLDSQGRVLPFTVRQGVPCPSREPCIRQEPVILAPGLGELVPHGLRPGQAALTLLWPAHDGTGTCTPPPVRAPSARLVLPEGGGELGVTLEPPAAPCGGQVQLLAFDLVREG